jgi:GMP synthase-like glutamine amidotransferase
MYTGEVIPSINDFDALVVMGGPMSVNDEKEISWLGPEKQLVHAAIGADKPVLGICLGAQMIADVLGAKVARMGYREIGYFPVSQICDDMASRFFKGLPAEFSALHWHGERFEIPAGAKRLARSEACDNQAFEYGSALGLQFHLEMNREILTNIIAQSNLEPSAEERFVQTKKIILKLEETYRLEHESLLIQVVKNWLG